MFRTWATNGASGVYSSSVFFVNFFLLGYKNLSFCLYIVHFDKNCFFIKFQHKFDKFLSHFTRKNLWKLNLTRWNKCSFWETIYTHGYNCFWGYVAKLYDRNSRMESLQIVTNWIQNYIDICTLSEGKSMKNTSWSQK